jgi:amino acid adenylation domain-containing protein
LKEKGVLHKELAVPPASPAKVGTLFGAIVELSGSCLHQLFEVQAANSPARVAVEQGEAAVSYGELNRLANRIAHLLATKGIGPGSSVLVSASPSIECIAVLLAIFKSGACYVPVDPAVPPARLADILGQQKISLAIATQELFSSLEALSAETILVHHLPQISADQPDTNLDMPDAWHSLAYVIFTSGSTGRPKGVLVHHAGIANLVQAMVRAWPIRSDSRMLQFASLGFDASVPEWTGPLTVGGTVVLKPRSGIMLGTELIDFLEHSKVSVLKMPAAALRALPAAPLPALRTIITAGDACTRELVDQWAPGRRFFNCYGPTEVSIGTCMAELTSGEAGPVTIGGPNPNLHVAVLGENLEPVGIGRDGELYVGGGGLAWGYVAQPGHTAERFVPSTLAGSGARMYRTGDSVRLMPGGALQFLGRLDEQLKLRGYRVELGEIEAALLDHPGIGQAAVKAIGQGGGEPALYAFVTSHGEAPKSDDLEIFLNARLPAYMVPSHFRHMMAMPLSVNGKIDKRALEASSGTDLERNEWIDAEQAPATDDERTLSRIWREELGRDVPVNRSFAALGGDSLGAAKVATQIERSLGLRITAGSILASAGIRDLLLPHLGQGSTKHLEDLTEEELDKLLAQLEPLSGMGDD